MASHAAERHWPRLLAAYCDAHGLVGGIAAARRWRESCTVSTLVCGRASNATALVAHYAAIAGSTRALAGMRVLLQPCGENARRASEIRAAILAAVAAAAASRATPRRVAA